MYKVYLVDEHNGNTHLRFGAHDMFDCEVWVDHHIYDLPNGCHYEIFKCDVPVQVTRR